MKTACSAIAVVVLVSALTAQPNQLRFDRLGEWRIPDGTVEISPDGAVTPRFMRGNGNALSGEIVDHLRAHPPRRLEDKDPAEISLLDAVLFGTDVRGTIRLMDGNLNTFWEPDLTVPPEDWKLVLDLGRVVLASKIVLHFLPQDEPSSLRFRVSSGVGEKLEDGRSVLDLALAGTTDGPDGNETAFEFTPAAMNTNAPGLTPLRFVEIRMLDAESVENGVPARLAEVEVMARGHNPAFGSTERGGSVTLYADGETGGEPSEPAIDGNAETFQFLNGETSEVVLDLGAAFWVDSVRLLVNRVGSAAPDGFQLEISDGTRDGDGALMWASAGDVSTPAGTDRYFDFAFDMELQRVRFLRAIPRLPSTGTAGLSEILVSGEGFVPDVVLTSDLINLGRLRNLVTLDWDADTPPGTRVALQTRTGNTLDTVSHYFDVDGVEITEQRYSRLHRLRKGAITEEFVPGEDWGPWSTPQTHPGSEITSRNVAEYALIRATLISDDTMAAPALRSVRLNTAPPLARDLRGEVWPNFVIEAGEPQDFSYYIRPEMDGRMPGFDMIRITTTDHSPIEPLAVLAGSEADFEGGGAQEVEFEWMQGPGPDSLWVRLPEPVRRGVELVEVRFRATIASDQMSFSAHAGLSSDPEAAWQRVTPGDATRLVGGDAVSAVEESSDPGLPDAFALAQNYPNPFNSGTVVRFALPHNSDVDLAIFNLAGQRVATLARGNRPAGQYTLSWDGRTDDGLDLASGIYLYRLQTRRATETRKLLLLR